MNSTTRFPELSRRVKTMTAITEYELNQLEALAEQRYITQSVAFQLAIAAPDLLEAIRAQRTALIAWQFQAAGAALALQRIMSAAQAMRDAQQAYEQYGSNEDSVTEAEEVFDGLLADMRKNFVK